MFSSFKYIVLAGSGLLVTALFLPCYSAQAPAQTPELTGIAHVAIRVSDLLKSRAFYEKLGFEEAFAMDQSGVPTEAFLKVNDRQFIELYPQHQLSQQIGFMHVCFESADLEGLNRFYLSRGLSPIPVRRAGAGNLLFTMEGPEKQNIEYTQYMPGSKHSNDHGKHLGPHRIAQTIVAVGIEMQNLPAARAFYMDKLAFTLTRPIEPGQIGLALPGASAEQVEIIQNAPNTTFQLFFSVPNLHQTAAQLKELQIPAEEHKRILSIRDPDGNTLVFVPTKQK